MLHYSYKVASPTREQGIKRMLNRPSTPAIDIVALDLLVEMIGADEPTAILDLLDTYLSDSTRQINALRAAFAAGDIPSVHRIAHSMKSSSATFGALGLSKHCENLERAARDNCESDECAQHIEQVYSEHDRVIESLTNERERFLT